MTYLWKYGDSLWNILRLNKSLTMWSRTTAILMNDLMIFFDPCIILRAIPFVFPDSCRIPIVPRAWHCQLWHGRKAAGPAWTPRHVQVPKPGPETLLTMLRNGPDSLIPCHPLSVICHVHPLANDFTYLMAHFHKLVAITFKPAFLIQINESHS